MLDLWGLPPGRVLARRAHYLYLKPHAALEGVVAHYTFTFPEEPPLPQKVEDAGDVLNLMPDISGCLVFSLNAPQKGRIWGATTKAVAVQRDFDAAPVRFFVEFCPGGAHRITGLEMAELTDAVFPLEDVLRPLGEEMGQVLAEEGTVAGMVAKVDDILLGWMLRVERPPVAAMLELFKSRQMQTVRQLADETGYSQRHLARLFGSSLGVGVKACGRIIRFNRALGMLKPGVSRADLALQAGYYDQAHFNHEFKQVCGVSPGVYLSAMSDFYKEEYKL